MRKSKQIGWKWWSEKMTLSRGAAGLWYGTAIAAAGQHGRPKKKEKRGKMQYWMNRDEQNHIYSHTPQEAQCIHSWGTSKCDIWGHYYCVVGARLLFRKR